MMFGKNGNAINDKDTVNGALGMSEMCLLKRVGPSIDPCGTPAAISSISFPLEQNI